MSNMLINVLVLILIDSTFILLGCCATNRKVAGSIPNGVITIFH